MNFDYESLLNKAMEKAPKKEGTGKRFKMPQVSSEIQGSKTLVKNIAEIASGMRREEDHVSRSLLKALAAPGSVQNGVLVIQAKVPRDTIQKKVEEYAKQFVFCKVCGEPDTKMEKSDRMIFLKCEACGARNPAKA